VVALSATMTWYDGPTLLEFLETVPLRADEQSGPLRFPVQLVLRPDANFRGFAGQVARGVLRAGERVMALPSRRETTVKRIVTWEGDLQAASYPQSVTVELANEIDLSRGEILVTPSSDEGLPVVSRYLRAMVVWMHEDPLVVGRTYLAKHTTRTVRATVKTIRYRVDVGSLDHVSASQLEMNEIAEIEFETSLPLFFDTYADSRTTGSLILIDGVSNATVGAAMITGKSETADNDRTHAAFVVLPGRAELAERLREDIEAHGRRAVIVDDPLISEDSLIGAVRALHLAGVTAISARTIETEALAATVQAIESFADNGVLLGEGLSDDEILRLAGVKE
jgi:sulfate adenylyltransferase subunit 1 (EFTu-like GTPase family)